MNIALVATNMIQVSASAGKGTEIFVHSFAYALKRRIDRDHLPFSVTSFASGDSDLPDPIESVREKSSADDPEVGMDYHKLFELALISKAFSMDDHFDLYHVHLSNGEFVLPFAAFTKKPILITMHGGTVNAYNTAYFDLYANAKNIHFVAISDNQRDRMHNLPIIRTIHHGIEMENYPFHPDGGETIMWAGRGIPDKGLDVVMSVAEKTGIATAMYPILKSEHLEWLKKEILSRRNAVRQKAQLVMDFDVSREELAQKYQQAKLFLFPIQWEEPFGLVLAESLASGTPIVAYAKGSVPEIVEDGVTGFLVNSCEEDKRGNYTITSCGIEGLLEAVQRIYSMPHDRYREMRRSCRDRAEKYFSIDRMVDDYLSVYQELGIR